jgi:hypothetical protein
MRPLYLGEVAKLRLPLSHAPKLGLFYHFEAKWPISYQPLTLSTNKAIIPLLLSSENLMETLNQSKQILGTFCG